MIHILIPARNEIESIGAVLGFFEGRSDMSVTVIDDNSTDKTYEFCKEHFKVNVLRNNIRIGRDQSLKVCMSTLTNLEEKDWVVFFDADQQHDPEFVFSINKYNSMKILKGRRFSKIQRSDLNELPLDRG